MKRRYPLTGATQNSADANGKFLRVEGFAEVVVRAFFQCHDAFGTAFDLGEAVAQSFGLAIDPYAAGPEADSVRREAGIVDEDAPSGPFAALAALKPKG